MSDCLDTMSTVAQQTLWYGPWLSVGAILLSGGIGAVIALKSINAQRVIARRRATLDILAKKEWDRDYVMARREFISLRDSKIKLDFWANKDNNSTPQASNIRSILNDYELMAVGIREDILDESLYRRWYRSTFISDYKSVDIFVKSFRENYDNPKAFVEMDWLYDRWK